MEGCVRILLTRVLGRFSGLIVVCGNFLEDFYLWGLGLGQYSCRCGSGSAMPGWSAYHIAYIKNIG